MSPNLVLGPLLRYAGASDATVWVETDAPCEVDVFVEGSSHRSRKASRNIHEHLRQMDEQASLLDKRLGRHVEESESWHRKWDDPS